jgi:predicted amidophosphoribosyltransferase
MADVIARRVARPDGATLVPVPLGPGRQRRRGYNQALLLARALGEAWRLPVDSTLLVRSRETDSQTAFDPAARRANVHGAFHAMRRGTSTDEMVVMIDDVLTTGATLLAAGTALVQRGWPPAGAVTFARALDAGGRITAGR